jgi:hypothetical protein
MRHQPADIKAFPATIGSPEMVSSCFDIVDAETIPLRLER